MEVNDACNFRSIGICLANEVSNFLENLDVGFMWVTESRNICQEGGAISTYTTMNLDFSCNCMILEPLLEQINI